MRFRLRSLLANAASETQTPATSVLVRKSHPSSRRRRALSDLTESGLGDGATGMMREDAKHDFLSTRPCSGGHGAGWTD